MDKQPFEKMEEILNGVLKPEEEMLRADSPSGEKLFMLKTVEIINRNIEETLDVARNRQKEFVWYEFCLTPELFFAFDLHPFLGELQPSLYSRARQDLIAEFIDAAEDSGVPPEVCSVDKVLVGSILCDEMPQPDLIVTTPAPCDSARVGYQLMEKLFDSPIHRLDAPFSTDWDAINYYAGQLRDLIPVLEKLSGKKFDIDRLREIVEESNHALEYLREWNSLRRLKPCPTPPTILDDAYGVLINNMGLPHCTEYCRLLLEFARERADSGAATREKIRVVWLNLSSQFGDNLYDWMAREFGAIVVDDTMSGWLRQLPIDTSSLDSMLLGLAQHGMNMTMGTGRLPAPLIVSVFLKACHNYSADCAIIAAHAGCKHLWGITNLLRDATREKGIPMLVCDIDFLDSRIVSQETIQHKLGQFFGTMKL